MSWEFEEEEEELFDEQENEEEEREETSEYQKVKMPWAALRDVADSKVAVEILRFLRKNSKDAFTAVELADGIGGYKFEHTIRKTAMKLATLGLLINQNILGKKRSWFMLNPRVTEEDLNYIEKWYQRRRERLERRHKKWLEAQRRRRERERMAGLIVEEL